jgi:dTDP-4-amino-4,6-dideoxygalactose transaminase
MLVTDDDALAAQARYLATQARDPVPHYEHRAIGYNYRLSNLLAAVGRGQVMALDDRVRARRATARYYRESLGETPGIEFMPVADYGEPNCWLSCILLDPQITGASPEDVRVHLGRHGIEARPTWKPMHLQPVFGAYPMRGGAVCEDVFRRGLCLPSGSSLTDGDRRRVVDAVRSACDRPLTASGARW